MQLSLNIDDQARQRGVDGANRAAGSAQRACSDWLGAAHAALLHEVQKHAHQDVFTIEQLRAKLSVETPPDLRAWGAVTLKAIAENHIVKTGQYAPAVSSNGSPKPLYKRGAQV